MVKKLKSIAQKKSAGAGGLLDSQLAQTVKDSAQQIWLAGMGAFAKAQAEGGKVFENLVKEGSSLQKKTQGLAEEKISEVSGKMSAMAENVTARAGQNWDKLEAIFEQRTAKALAKLGVPTASELDALKRRVDDLQASMSRPAARGKASAKAPARASTSTAKTGSARTAGTTAPTSTGAAPRRAPRKAV